MILPNQGHCTPHTRIARAPPMRALPVFDWLSVPTTANQIGIVRTPPMHTLYVHPPMHALCMYPLHAHCTCTPPHTLHMHPHMRIVCAPPMCTLPVFDWLSVPTTANEITGF